MKEILKKLQNIQQELSVPKNQRNTFGNYNFRNCEDIMEASKPICKKNNCLLTCSDEIVELDSRYYVKATAKLYDVDSTESIECYGFAREEETKKGMDASQVTGASSSYARKYALNGLLQLDDNKDADTNEYKRAQQETTKTGNKITSMITTTQIKQLQTILGKKEGLKETVYKQMGISSSKELTYEKAKALIDDLNKKVK